MKTREQLIEEIEKVRVDFATKPFPFCSSKILDLVVSACEEAMARKKTTIPLEDYGIGFNHAIELTLKNLKKLKSK